MKRRWLMLALALLLVAGRAWATDPDPDRVQRALGWLVGSWDATETHYKDGKKVAEGAGTCEFRWVLEGKFLSEEYRSRSPMGDYHGQGLIQWDPQNGDYKMWWFDAEGESEAYAAAWDGGDRRVLYATGVREGKPYAEREVYTRISDREYHYLLEEDTGSGWVPVWGVICKKRP